MFMHICLICATIKFTYLLIIAYLLKCSAVGLPFKEWTHNVMQDDDYGMLCVTDIDVAISVFIIFQRLFCKSLQVVSKVLVFVLVLVAPVLVDITAF